MRYESYGKDPGFASRIGLLAVGFTGFDFGSKDAHQPPRDQSEQVRNRGLISSLKSLLAKVQSMLVRVSRTIVEARERRRTLEVLEGLDDRLLRDIGLTRGDVIDLRLGQSEISKVAARGKPRSITPVEEKTGSQPIPFPKKTRHPSDGDDFKQAA